MSAEDSTDDQATSVEREIDEEIAFHLEARIADLKAKGMDMPEARARALARFGDVARIRRACLVQRNWRSIMLHRVHLTVTVVLAIAAAFLGIQSVRAQAASDARLAELSQAVASLQTARVDRKASTAGDSPPRRMDRSKVVVGDVLRVVDTAFPDELDATVKVMEDGQVLIPHLGWVAVSGRTLSEIDEELNRLIEPARISEPSIATTLEQTNDIELEAVESIVIASGAVLQVKDESHPLDINFTVRVASDGTLLMDQIGRIHVAGYTREDVESILNKRYQNFYVTSPSIRVSVLRNL